MLDPQHFYGSGLTASLRLARCCERLRDGSFLVLELLVPKINKNITINFKFRWGRQASFAQRDGGNLPHSGEAVLGLSIWPLHDLLDALWADMEETSLGLCLPGELAAHLQAQADDINKLTLYLLTIGHARLLTSKKPFVCNLGLDECNMDDAIDERMDEAYSPEDSLPEDLRCPAPPSPGTAAPVDPVKCSGPGRRARSGMPP